MCLLKKIAVLIAAGTGMGADAAKTLAKNGFKVVIFETTNHKNNPIYHTDVLMFVGTNMIGLCNEVINDEYKEEVLSKAKKYHN